MIYNFDELSFQVVAVQRFFHKPGIFEVKARSFAAFSFRVSGTGVFEVGGRRLVSEPGDVLFLPADTPYRVEYSVGESIVVHLRACNYGETESIRPQNREWMELTFGRMLEDWNRRRSVNQTKAMIYDILEKLDRDGMLSMRDTAFAQCVAFIDAHFCDPTCSVEQICHAGFMSASGLGRAFRAHMGLSPMQYVSRLRMNRALELLSEREKSIREIALACGFEDEKYFSRAFKKKYGYPPSYFYKRAFV